MGYGEFPEDVARFIAEHIQSVEQLEVLLLLRAHDQREWDAEAVSEELRIDRVSAESRLADLQGRGLLSVREGPPETPPNGDPREIPSGPRYRYHPRSSRLEDAVRRVGEAYAERRVSVINLIFSKPVEKVRLFADAFRLTRGEDKDG